MKKELITFWAFLVLTALWGQATTIDPQLWQQMAVSCDFAGVIECTFAGGIVAEYKVVDSWKGPAHTEPIHIQVAVNYWEPQFPMTLVGEQYLVFAFKGNAPARIASMSGGGPVPLWWRQIEYDYTLPLFQGRYRLDVNQDIVAYDFGYRSEDKKTKAISEIENDVRQLVTQTKPQQESVLLKLLFNKYFVKRNKEELESTLDHLKSYENATDADKHQDYIQEMKSKAKQYQQQIEEVEPVLKKIKNSNDPIELIDLIYDLSISDYKTYRFSFRAVLGQAILTTESLEHLEKRIATTDAALLDDYAQKYIPQQIQARIAPAEPIQPTEPEAKTYTTDDLNQHQAILKDYKKKEPHEWSKSFNVLVEKDPGRAAKWLKGWKNPHEEWRDEGMGYGLGSWLAYRCDKDREKCLDILLDAKEPYVRVAGAVYWCFEDETKGMKYLNKFRDFKDDPGLWATINLARRGDKTAVKDMLWFYRSLPSIHEGNMPEVPRRNLAKRLMVLLSNSAAKSSLPQPPNMLENPNNYNSQIRQLCQWWVKHESKIALYDPWMDILKEQKID